MKTTILSAILCLFVFMTSCSSGGSDDGDPIVEKKASLSGKITITDTDAWPTGSKKLILRGYKSTDRSALAFEKTLAKPAGNLINFKIDDLTLGALSDIEIAIVDGDNPSAFDTRMYYGSFIVKAEDQITLPELSMTLGGTAPEFLLSKIEDKIFAPKCFSCHNSKVADRDLDLSKWQTYSHTVNVKSKINTTRDLVKPGDVASSFLYQMLEDPNLAPDMLPVALTKVEMDLIKRWINEGAKKE
ncbi:hypothetical protein L3073_07200 [Ancylomarina sp. DW003]|nr:hypothetical protein [Ancylomarina sp. DW003]MDE5421991.1 hypothetical protein [Ancylomarina sp. DW003]